MVAMVAGEAAMEVGGDGGMEPRVPMRYGLEATRAIRARLHGWESCSAKAKWVGTKVRQARDRLGRGQEEGKGALG